MSCVICPVMGVVFAGPLTKRTADLVIPALVDGDRGAPSWTRARTDSATAQILDAKTSRVR